MTTKMKTTCRVLVVAMLALSFQTARAGMIGTGEAASAQTERSQVVSVLSRADAASQLQAQGIDPKMALDRVASMTDQEVRTLAANMHTAPAGADGGTALAVIVIGAAIWYFAFRK